jgi:Lon-like protease
VTSPTDLRARPARRPEPRRPVDRTRLGWTLLTIALALVVVLGLSPSGYVIEQPGPVYDTLGDQGADGEPLIRIDGADTHPTDGSLDLTTVTVVGSPRGTPDLLRVALAWFDPRKSVKPLEAAFPAGVSSEERDEQSRLQMQNSQQEAIAAALTELGYDIPRTLTVQGVVEGAPAEGVLEEGDQVLSVNGADIANLTELRDAIAANGTGEPAALGILRDGAERTVDVTPTTQQGQTVVGVGVAVAYEFPFDVEIELPNVGGPSAGMTFALGIYDKLTPGSLTGGERIAGTGTIDAEGAVGPIGGIRQKLYGAQQAGADWFLAPESNCDQVVGHVPEGMDVVAVGTLDDALAAVEAIADGKGMSGLPTCTAR